jgi:hypothetical protein
MTIFIRILNFSSRFWADAFRIFPGLRRVVERCIMFAQSEMNYPEKKNFEGGITMKKAMLFVLVLIFALGATCAVAAASAVKRGDYFITVLTGPSSGIYFPIGGAFSTFIGSLGYKTSATATGATAENINALLTGQGEMAIAMADSVIQAVEAFGAYAGQPPAKELRAMMGLWPNFCQIVTTADSGIKTFAHERQTSRGRSSQLGSGTQCPHDVRGARHDLRRL